MNIKAKDVFKVNYNGKNPYAENSVSWHVYIDVCIAGGDRGAVFKVQDLVNYSNLELEYYETGLQELIFDQLVLRVG
jgi:Na+-translocating ferredoxin:NAD+ oxidoreductase RNF subunit RnfB